MTARELAHGFSAKRRDGWCNWMGSDHSADCDALAAALQREMDKFHDPLHCMLVGCTNPRNGLLFCLRHMRDVRALFGRIDDPDTGWVRDRSGMDIERCRGCIHGAHLGTCPAPVGVGANRCGCSAQTPNPMRRPSPDTASGKAGR